LASIPAGSSAITIPIAIGPWSTTIPMGVINTIAIGTTDEGVSGDRVKSETKLL